MQEKGGGGAASRPFPGAGIHRAIIRRSSRKEASGKE